MHLLMPMANIYAIWQNDTIILFINLSHITYLDQNDKKKEKVNNK